VEATLCGCIVELEGKLEQCICEEEDMEATLRGIISELEEKLDESGRSLGNTETHERSGKSPVSIFFIVKKA
jgi:hypothetical protein